MRTNDTPSTNPGAALFLRLGLACFGLYVTIALLFAGPLAEVGRDPDGTLDPGRRAVHLFNVALFVAGVALLGTWASRRNRPAPSLAAPARPTPSRGTSPALLYGLAPALLLVAGGLGARAWLRRPRASVDERVPVPPGTPDLRELQTTPRPGLYVGKLLQVSEVSARGVALSIGAREPQDRFHFQGAVQPNDGWLGDFLATRAWLTWTTLGIDEPDSFVVPFRDTRYPWLGSSPGGQAVLVRIVQAADGAFEITELTRVL